MLQLVGSSWLYDKYLVYCTKANAFYFQRYGKKLTLQAFKEEFTVPFKTNMSLKSLKLGIGKQGLM